MEDFNYRRVALGIMIGTLMVVVVTVAIALR